MYKKTKQILTGATSYLASGIVTSVGTFLVSILVSHNLGKEGLGVFSVALSVVLMGVIVSELGLNPLIMREFASGGNPVRSLRSILFIRFVASGVVASIVFVAGIVVHLTNPTALILLGTVVLIVSRSTGSALENYLKAQLRNKAFMVLSVLSAAVQLALVYLLLDTGFGTGEVLLALAGVDIFKLFVLIFLAGNELARVNSAADGDWLDLKLLLAQSSPFMLIGLMIFLGERADIFLLASLKDSAEVGLYTAADRFLVLGSLVDSSLFASTLPILSSISNHSDKTRVTRQTFLVSVSLAAVGGLALFLAAPILIRSTFRFTESVVLLQILSVAVPALIANRVLRTALYSLHKERPVALALTIASIAALSLNVLFIPFYGSTAAATITVGFEYVLVFLYGWMYLKNVRSVS